MLEPAAIPAVVRRLEGIANKTPVMTSRTLDHRAGRAVFLKCENFQRVGAFKFRGAYNAISQLTEDQRAAGVITHSSGNHAQAVALAARLLGVKAVIVMPEDAPAVKRAATEGYGAEIITAKAIEREKVTADLVAKHGYTLVHPYDNDNIILGQATAAYELFAEVGPLDTLFVPVGGGGLISGSALATALQSPGCRVVGVEPELAADANRSWREGRVVELDYVPQTIADGLRTRYIGDRNLTVMERYVHDMTTVSEDQILDTVEFLWTYLKIVVEPSSAVALAPLLHGTYAAAGERVGVILSGGNVNVPACGFFHRGTFTRAAAATTAAAQPPEVAAEADEVKILVTDPLDRATMALLEDAATVDVRLDLSEEELIRVVGDYHVLMVGPQRHISSDVIKYGFHLRAIGCPSARLDNIDVSTARAMGIQVFHVPGGNAVAIAEHTLARLLMLVNSFADGRLAGKTLGLVGFGSVGREVAQRARAFDMDVLVNQPRLTPELAFSAGVEETDLLELLGQADFVSLHVPYKAETKTIIGARELAAVKPGAFLVNTGHTELVDEAALLAALEDGQLGGAALSTLPEDVTPEDTVFHDLRHHERVLVAPHVTTIIDKHQPNLSLTVAREIVELLETRRASETLSLEVVPVAEVTPHERIDDKRVARLMDRLEEDARLVNPPLAAYWKSRYVILDGATRFTAFKRLGYPHIILQLVDPDQSGFELHTWYHVISHETAPFTELLEELEQIEALSLRPLAPSELQSVLQEPHALCYFLDRAGGAVLAEASDTGLPRLTIMNQLVDTYTGWGRVERTLLTDLPRLQAQFPDMCAVAVFPQFSPTAVFEAAAKGEFLPAGLTRFLIPGRILRLNADLARLKRDEPLAVKRAWFNEFVAEKLSRSRLRYYQEPVILLDE